MPAGLQVFNADGVDILDITSNVGLYLGVIEVQTYGGSIVVPGFSFGTPFYMIQQESITYGFPGYEAIPFVTISGNTLSWSWSQYGSFEPITIIYGIY